MTDAREQILVICKESTELQEVIDSADNLRGFFLFVYIYIYKYIYIDLISSFLFSICIKFLHLDGLFRSGMEWADIIRDRLRQLERQKQNLDSLDKQVSSTQLEIDLNSSLSDSSFSGNAIFVCLAKCQISRTQR